MKVVIVGGGAGGISTASNIRKIDKNIEITVLTRDNNVAYSPCAIPYVLAGKIKSFYDIIMKKPEDYKEKDIDVAWVPGAFEIPLIAAKMAKSEKYDAIICLGAVIRGSTSHYDYVCNEVSKGISAISLKYDLPVMFGVITTENIEQAIERAGTKAGNKGYDCALGAIEMVNLIKEIEK